MITKTLLFSFTRDGCSWFFDELKKYDIPVLIFSAGIGDIIEEILRQQSTIHDNMHIVSNYMKFDDQVSLIQSCQSFFY